MSRTISVMGFALGVALLGALTGCVNHSEGPSHATVYAPPQTVYVENGIVVQDDYVYYPGYQVYYSSNRRQYIYRDGRSWVSRPQPPRVSIDVLFASPSVRLDFHDSPALHHGNVMRQYPRNWAPPKSNPDRGQGNRNDGKRNDRGGRR